MAFLCTYMRVLRLWFSTFAIFIVCSKVVYATISYMIIIKYGNINIFSGKDMFCNIVCDSVSAQLWYGKMIT